MLADPPSHRVHNNFVISVDDGPIFLPFAMSAREMRLIDEFYDHGFSDDELYGDDEEFFEDDDDFYTDDDDYTDDDFDDEDEDEDDDEEVELTAEQQAAIRQRCAQQ